MSRLPQELIDRIIDHVDDRKSLKACSLVCSRWSHRSRKHLFTQVEFASKGPATLVRLHPPRTVRAILPRRASDPIGTSFLARTLAILDCLIDCHRCRSPLPVLVRAPGAGGSGMAHGYNLRSVDVSFLWALPQKCDTFDTEGCRCSGHSPLNPQDVLRPLPTSR